MRPLFLLLLLSIIARAENEKIKNPMLFSLAKGNRHWWILGSHHAGIEITEFPDSVLRPFYESSVFVAETSSLRPVAAQITSEAPLRPETEAVLLTEGFSRDKVRKVSRGWLCIAYEIGADAIRKNKMMDRNFERLATFLGIRPIFLDDERDLAHIEKSALTCNPDMFIALHPPDTMRRERLRQISQYRAGELSKYEDQADLPIIKERNAKWMEILNRIDETNAFILVGAAHLAGPTGLLQLFRNEGFAVTRW